MNHMENINNVLGDRFDPGLGRLVGMGATEDAIEYAKFSKQLPYEASGIIISYGFSPIERGGGLIITLSGATPASVSPIFALLHLDAPLIVTDWEAHIKTIPTLDELHESLFQRSRLPGGWIMTTFDDLVHSFHCLSEEQLASLKVSEAFKLPSSPKAHLN